MKTCVLKIAALVLSMVQTDVWNVTQTVSHAGDLEFLNVESAVVSYHSTRDASSAMEFIFAILF